MPQNLPHQFSERHRARQIWSVGCDVDARQHHLARAGVHRAPHRRHHLARRDRARRPAAERNDAERAAVIAPILHLHVGARALAEAGDQMPRRLPHAHDVVDLHARAARQRQPRKRFRLELLDIADDVIDFCHRGECFRLCLGGATRNDQSRARLLALQAPDRLPRPPHRLARHRAGVDDDCGAKARGRCMRRHHVALVRVQAAAERDDARCPPMFEVAIHVLPSGVPLNIAASYHPPAT